MSPDWGAEPAIHPQEIQTEGTLDPDQLFERLRDELHRLATQAMAGERKDHTLQPTALLHEVWIRLFSNSGFGQGADRTQVLRVADQVMRQILVDHARRRSAKRRGGRRQRVPLDAVIESCDHQGLDVLEIHEALEKLERLHERQARIVSLRFFWGFTVVEIAEQLDVSLGLVEHDFRLARAWLRRHLRGFA